MGLRNGVGEKERHSLRLKSYNSTFPFTEETNMNMKFTAIFQKVPEGYISFIEELPGANTQGATLIEAQKNLNEAVQLMLEANRTLAEELIKGKHVIRKPFHLRAA